MLFVVMDILFYTNRIKGLTLQIGNLPKLAKLLGQRVVCDFRVQDVRLGWAGSTIGSDWRCLALWSHMIIV